MSWFQKGAEGAKLAKEDEDERAKNAGVFRFWLPVGGNAEFTFLDTEGFFFKEHNFFANGSWMNWETCIQDIGEEDCPFCEMGLKYYYECVFSIIDHTEYVSKKTQQRMRDMKKLLVLRSTARKKILRKKDQTAEGDLTYCKFSAYRDSKQECSTGEDFELISRATREEVLRYAPNEYMGRAINAEDWIKPFDYLKIFEPKSAEALRRVLGRVPDPIGAGDSPNIGRETSGGDRNANRGDSDDNKPSVQSLL